MGLDKDGEKGLLKRLKNIEDKNQEQLKAIKGKTGLKSQIDLFEKELSSKAVTLLKEIKEIKDNVDYDKLFFTGGNKKVHRLKNFKTLEKLTSTKEIRKQMRQKLNKMNFLKSFANEKKTQQGGLNILT